MIIGLSRLSEFRVDADPDRNLDPYLIHTPCGEQVCLIEHNDTLGLLTGIAGNHDCPGGDVKVQESRLLPVLARFDAEAADMYRDLLRAGMAHGNETRDQVLGIVADHATRLAVADPCRAATAATAICAILCALDVADRTLAHASAS